MKTPRNLAIALLVGGALFAAPIFLETSQPGLDFGATKFVLPMVLGTGLFSALNAKARNRRVPVANDARKAELLGFRPRPGSGWVAVMRDKGTVAAAMGFDISVDDVEIAQLMPKRFTLIALPAGPHRLFADIVGAPGASAVAPLDIEMVQGAVMIFAVRASMGLVRTSLRLDPVADTPAVRAALARMLLVEPAGARP